MQKFRKLERIIQEEIPLKIKYKHDSGLMKFMNFFVKWFNPDYMDYYTTTIGYTIYFPDEDFIKYDEDGAMRILAHEAVHLMDAKKYSKFLFMFGYAFPQILAIGVFSFPWLGWWSLLFLIFLAPIPAPFRCFFEVRAYAINIITNPYADRPIDRYLDYFKSWDYYKMYPFENHVRTKLQYWIDVIDRGEDKVLQLCLNMYERAIKEE